MSPDPPADAHRKLILLRGINVGQRRLAMSRLREVLADAGVGDVQTLLQSGNAVGRSDLDEQGLVRACTEAISAAAGFSVDVIVRSADEVAQTIAADPFGDLATDPARYLVSFCTGPADGEAEARLRAACGLGERVEVMGREIYSWHPDGVGRSKLWAELSRLGSGAGTAAPASARNWRTVIALAELLAG